MTGPPSYGSVPTSEDARPFESERRHKWRLTTAFRRPQSSTRTTATSAVLLLAAASAITLIILNISAIERAIFKRHLSTVITQYPSFAVNISHTFNNIAAGPGADFDPHSHGSYPVEYLPTKSFVYDGVKFTLPADWSDGQPDNVKTDGEEIPVAPKPVYIRELHILYAGDWIDGESGARFTLHFKDGTRDVVEVSAKNWWTLHWLNQGVIRAPYHYEPSGKNHNVTQMYHWSAGVRSDSPLVSVTLPESHWPNHFHLFSLSLVPSDTHAVRPKISVRRVLPTTKWRIIDGIKAYALEVTLTNPLPSSNIAKSELWVKGPYTVSVGGDELKTVLPGVVDRIMPSDEVRVKVWVVETSPSVPAAAFGGRVKVKVSGETDRVTEVFGDFDLAKAFDPSPATRDTPEWWDDAKFGIFIHWGLYSVPGWAPKGWYAAWYWWWMHKWPNPDNGFWRYHKEHYGTDVVYDDFIEEFKPSQFNASEWIDIFGESGAKYFVLVTKHHDGFALFDTKDSTHRSSWHLGPKRDFIRELFDAAKAERPEMHRGTYISMPEWYNPDSGAGGYGFGDWPGQLAHNAFDYSKLEPYTGRVPGKDYLRDQQLAQMNMLAYDYDTEIMASPWCDIGGPNLTNEFAEGWYPYAESQGRQVVMNNRCGDIPQFDTPEYTRFSSIQTVKWETSEGIDPHCYAYNRATKPEEYKSARTVLHSLIDIVSKNGNYLIGLGPTADGIIVEPVVERMLDVGKWLKHSGDCVYGTKYFFPGAEHHDLRFTQTDSTFCIISFEKPQDGQLRVGRDVPVMNGDKISLLGGGKAGEDLKWHLEGGKLVVDVPDEAVELVELAWAFKVEYA